MKENKVNIWVLIPTKISNLKRRGIEVVHLQTLELQYIRNTTHIKAPKKGGVTTKKASNFNCYTNAEFT